MEIVNYHLQDSSKVFVAVIASTAAPCTVGLSQYLVNGHACKQVIERCFGVTIRNYGQAAEVG